MDDRDLEPPAAKAGIGEYKFIDWYREHALEDDLKMLAWSDEALDGKGYVDWYAYDHPQLGPVELGGWDHVFAFRNPPAAFGGGDRPVPGAVGVGTADLAQAGAV